MSNRKSIFSKGNLRNADSDTEEAVMNHTGIQIERQGPDFTSEAMDFSPFEYDLTCPSCKKEMGMVLSPIHLRTEIHCPECMRPLTRLVRRVIQKQTGLSVQ